MWVPTTNYMFVPPTQMDDDHTRHAALNDVYGRHKWSS